MFINIHTHQPCGDNNKQVCIRNRSAGFDAPFGDGYWSVGLHPWHLSGDIWHTAFEELRKASAIPGVVAIGECGLDKLCGTDWALQVEAFRAQLSWANEAGKPVVIHCVRAFQEVLRMIEDSPRPKAIIFHGFNRSVSLADSILQAGHYISLGPHVMQENGRQLASHIPPNRLFLETDDSPSGIEEIYIAAAGAMKLNMDSLILQIQENARRVFGIDN